MFLLKPHIEQRYERLFNSLKWSKGEWVEVVIKSYRSRLDNFNYLFLKRVLSL